MEFVLVVCAVIVAYAMYEYRVRKPDQIILRETRSGLSARTGLLYPRHFSLPISRTAHSFSQTIDASAEGSIEIRIKLAVSVVASMKDLGTLMRVGGWKSDAVARAAKELEMVLLGAAKGFTELHEFEEIASDTLRAHLLQQLSATTHAHGLEIVSLTVASLDPVNPQIAEAMRQREHARILEQAEMLNQQARIAAAKVRLKADEEIATMENALELKRYELKRKQAEQESALAAERIAHETRMKKMQLEVDKEELRLLKEHPELLLLTPQAARLAEASQALKNARTVVSLSPNESPQGNELLGVFHALVQNALDAYKKKSK